ncbi:beta-ketoacyl synthase N-terminal-like domain-containing protein [Streptomyces sp. NPDC050625]|uniref:beta-ketoacyl synthase N-terminal-like domain-containing protein n=1 Tax=Streptomyces sp. NPDC050625 TaxID=3154629 RepID=UPI00341A828F
MGLDDPTAFLAVIGMAGRFPGAANVEQFWANSTNGTDSVTRFAEPSEQPRGHVPAMGLLQG